MNIHLRHILFFITLLYSCAQMAVPTGGEKDTIAPVLDEKNCFPANGSVNFSGSKIHLSFDEYIRLNNPLQQVLISPALPGNPQYIHRGKSVDILLPEGLMPNTTYSIHFGNSISDLTEGNIAGDLQYVFSTGPFLDSLMVSGRVTNALSGAVEKNAMVGLYPAGEDSAFFKRKPLYLALTNSAGEYSIRNVRSGEYDVFALKESNSTFMYDAPGEEAGFYNGSVKLGEGINASQIDIPLIREMRDKFYIRKREFSEPGRLQLLLSRSGFGEVRIPGADKIEIRNDSILLWIKDSEISQLPVMIYDKEGNTLLTDTVRISRDEKKRNTELTKKLNYRTNSAGNLDRFSPLYFYFNEPVQTEKNTSLVLLYDSIKTEVEIEQITERILQLKYDFKDAGWEQYSLVIPSGTFGNIFRTSNTDDTLRFKVHKEDFYGKLILLFSRNTDENLLLQLMNEKGQVWREVKNPNSGKIEFPELKPGTYRLRVILDMDANGEWSPGAIAGRIAPEKIIHFDQNIVIRSNWDLEMNWDLKNF